MLTHNDDDSSLDQPSLDKLITLREAAELSGLSAGHLRLLVSQGDMWGVKIGRNWDVGMGGGSGTWRPGRRQVPRGSVAFSFGMKRIPRLPLPLHDVILIQPGFVRLPRDQPAPVRQLHLGTLPQVVAALAVALNKAGRRGGLASLSLKYQLALANGTEGYNRPA
jgi:hypothetical protein